VPIDAAGLNELTAYTTLLFGVHLAGLVVGVIVRLLDRAVG
jgi:hypothetical protein